MRQMYHKESGEWLDPEEYYFRKAVSSQISARSDVACPYIASDVMDPVQSQLDGRMYDSKSKLRATYRAAGMIEVGNDPARLRPRQRPTPDRQGIRDSLKKAMEQAASRA